MVMFGLGQEVIGQSPDCSRLGYIGYSLNSLKRVSIGGLHRVLGFRA